MFCSWGHLLMRVTGGGGMSPKHFLSTLGRIFKFLSILGYNLFICALQDYQNGVSFRSSVHKVRWYWLKYSTLASIYHQTASFFADTALSIGKDQWFLGSLRLEQRRLHSVVWVAIKLNPASRRGQAVIRPTIQLRIIPRSCLHYVKLTRWSKTAYDVTISLEKLASIFPRLEVLKWGKEGKRKWNCVDQLLLLLRQG